MLIDTHCHLTYDELRPQVDAVLERARQAGVTRCITVGTTPADAARALALAAGRAGVFVAAGVHPHHAAEVSDADLAYLSDLHAGKREAADFDAPIVAVGEAGLDFHYDFAPPDVQERVFRAQLRLASEIGRPVIIHARQAERRVCEILADYRELRGRAVFHCFSGDSDLAAHILDAGHWISFTGVATFRNGDGVRAAARLCPADRIMVETDAPFLSPEPLRKIRPCEPAFVAHTARRIAEERGSGFEEFCELTTANAVRFFGLPIETSGRRAVGPSDSGISA
ncbi:MAG: TatD family hydrolase [Phycisphaerales bacterium]|nr:TatD family hydrolase [Phycisphaerales bacterium]